MLSALVILAASMAAANDIEIPLCTTLGESPKVVIKAGSFLQPALYYRGRRLNGGQLPELPLARANAREILQRQEEMLLRVEIPIE